MSISNEEKIAAFRALINSTQTFREYYDPETFRAWLAEELTREAVLAEIAARRQPPIADVAAGAADAGSDDAAADQRTAELLQVAIKALSFYADSDAYAKRGPKPSFISTDKGDVARDALQSIDAFIKLQADRSK